MLNKIRNRKGGFTLIELLIVIAIIGIIAALLIPNFLDALQKAKQKRTVADERNIGTAEFSWLTDILGAAAAGASTTTNYDVSAVPVISHGDLSAILSPMYIQSTPVNDGWQHAFEFRLAVTNPLALQVMVIRSFGRDGTFSGTSYEVTNFTPTQYGQDIVWADGFFVRWPQGNAPAP